MKVELCGAEAEFVRAEAQRLDCTPEDVLTLMVQCQMLADRAAGTTLGQQAMAQAAAAVRAMQQQEGTDHA